MFHLCRQVVQLLAALFFYFRRQLSRQQGGPGAGAGGIRKNVNPGKSRFLAEIQCLPPFRDSFPRKPGNDIGGDVQVGNMLPQFLRQSGKVRAPATPPHALQYAVTAALHRQVQVRHESRVVEQLEKIAVNIPGFQGPQPQPGNVGVGKDGFDQRRQVGVQVMPVSADMHAGQYRFPDLR